MDNQGILDEYCKLREQIHQQKVNALSEIQQKMNFYGFNDGSYKITAGIYPERDRESMVISVSFPKDEKKLAKLTAKIFKSSQSPK